MSFSDFVKNKSDLMALGVKFLSKLKNNYRVSVNTIRCDTTKECITLQGKFEDLNFGVTFEYTVSGTPQHNSVVKRIFPTLYGRFREMLNGTDFVAAMREMLWAESTAAVTMVNNILVDKKKDKSPFKILCKKKPKYGNNLRMFDEIEVVQNYECKLKAKLDNCGKVYAMIGYSNAHSGDVYRKLYLNTK